MTDNFVILVYAVVINRVNLSKSVNKDVPRCREDKEELLGALKQETVVLKCEVDANPPLVTFKWTFNNSGEPAEVPPSRYTASGTGSTLNYTPVSEMDYGTLSCWGTNKVGEQKTPCLYQVIAAVSNLHAEWKREL
uniref:Ig-like domain-containing protein n=1 Tax=Rhodnius prolixus TaxID=13249 RepID=T1HJG2_RHOPR